MNTTPAMRFPDSMTLANARADFFAASGLGQDGGYAKRWVRVETRPVAVYFPNSACRVAAAKLHDLHHIATEYDVDWTGESEIAGWEIASGCGRHGWAWMLNLGAFTVGLVRSPRRMFRAFVRGRRVNNNLYKTGFADDNLELITVGSLRHRLGLNASQPHASTRDIFSFAAWALAGIAWHLAVGAGALASGLVGLRLLGLL